MSVSGRLDVKKSAGVCSESAVVVKTWDTRQERCSECNPTGLRGQTAKSTVLLAGLKYRARGGVDACRLVVDGV